MALGRLARVILEARIYRRAILVFGALNASSPADDQSAA
jgi:hypothetical protein